MSKSINIRPTTSVYATYKNIKYDPWTAIAEFVDNSTQSYYDHVEQLEKTKYWSGLEVKITYEKDKRIGDRLVITDNAYGMDFNDFKRAIMLDSPPKKSSRSEFGMGLKTAACWFGVMWSVETTELGSDVKYKATVDVEALKKYKNEEITVEEIPCHPKEHGTVITIWKLNRTMSSRQIGKTKDQLRGMYRTDLRSGKINIFYNDDGLEFISPKVLVEELPDGTKKTWKKDVAFDVICNGKKYSVNGFIALLEEGSVSGAGFTLIRHGRVIVGGYENGYRPEEVFEKSNSFVYQRLFGELNLDDWPVTQTKDSFDWYRGLEDLFIERLLEVSNEYRKKAKEYRKGKKVDVSAGITELVNNFANAGIIENANVSDISNEVISHITTLPDDDNKEEQKDGDTDQTTPVKEKPVTGTPQKEPIQPTDLKIVGSNGQKISFSCDGEEYVFNFILKNDNPDARWLNIKTLNGEYIIEWNIRHPFFKAYSDDPKFVGLMQQFAFAIALSEIEAKRTSTDGKIVPSAIRTKMNETLKAVIKEK